jgi:hypothetical protein
MMFKEIIAVYTENHTKHINTLCGPNAELVIVKECGTRSYHWHKSWLYGTVFVYS